MKGQIEQYEWKVSWAFKKWNVYERTLEKYKWKKLLKIKGHVVQNKLKVLWSDLFLRINWAIQMKGLISF